MATSGIGLATAKLFVNERAHVVVMGRRQKELDEAANLIGHPSIPIQEDISDLADIDRFYETIRPYGPIHIVFANAGFSETGSLTSCTEEQFDWLFNTNVKGSLFTVQKALPMMKDGGSIILTGSVSSAKGTPGLVCTAQAKLQFGASLVP